VKALIIADVDDLKWRGGSGKADIVISCGDTAECLVLEAARAFMCDCIVAVKGNHDPDTPFMPPVVDLHLAVREFGGLRFAGFGGAWRYKPRGLHLYEQDEVEAELAKLPPVDILVCHNSPLGVHDRPDGIHTGFSGLNTYIRQSRPRLLIHGHQHQNIETLVDTTRVIGVYGHRLLDLPSVLP